jgi:hypothetical protein
MAYSLVVAALLGSLFKSVASRNSAIEAKRQHMHTGATLMLIELVLAAIGRGQREPFSEKGVDEEGWRIRREVVAPGGCYRGVRLALRLATSRRWIVIRISRYRFSRCFVNR